MPAGTHVRVTSPFPLDVRSPRALRSVSTSALRRELERREQGARRLLQRRQALAGTLAALDAELSALGLLRATAVVPRQPARRAAGGGRRRAHNATSLPEVIAKVVRVGATVSPADVATRVKSAGYKSTAAHFGMMVSNALAKDARFRRVSRGQYERVK